MNSPKTQMYIQWASSCGNWWLWRDHGILKTASRQSLEKSFIGSWSKEHDLPYLTIPMLFLVSSFSVNPSWAVFCGVYSLFPEACHSVWASLGQEASHRNGRVLDTRCWIILGLATQTLLRIKGVKNRRDALDEYIKLMHSCWDKEPTARPSYRTIVHRLQHIRDLFKGRPPPCLDRIKTGANLTELLNLERRKVSRIEGCGAHSFSWIQNKIRSCLIP